MPEPTTAQATVALDRSPELALTALYRAAIGPIRTDYYAAVFGRFEASGHPGLSWNWAACACTLNWMLFRGLWGAALVYLALLVLLPLLGLVLSQLVFDWPAVVNQGLLLAGLVLAFVLPGALGNPIFHAKSRKDMAAALTAHSTLNDACAALQKKAGSRQRLIQLLLGNAALLTLAAAAYLFWPHPAGVASLGGAPAQGTAAVTIAGPVAPAAPASAGSQAAAPAPALVTDALTTAAGAVQPAPAPAPASAAVSAPEPARAPSAAAVVAPVLPGQGPVRAAAPPVLANATPVASAVPPARASSAAARAVSPAPPSRPASAAKTAAKPTAAQDFYINVGLFANTRNARGAYEKLKAAGLPTVVQSMETRQGPRVRVRVGPLQTRAQADAAIKKIKALELDAVLVK